MLLRFSLSLEFFSLGLSNLKGNVLYNFFYTSSILRADGGMTGDVSIQIKK